VFPEVRQRLRRFTQVAMENGALLLMLRWHGRCVLRCPHAAVGARELDGGSRTRAR
jgi:hypothetical protein